MGHGMGSTMAPMTAAVMNAVGPQRAGLGSAMTNTSREVGGVFGIALLGTILFTRLTSVLKSSLDGLGPDRATASRHHRLGRSRSIRRRRLASRRVNRHRWARHSVEAFMSGFQLALLFAAAVLLVAAVVANREIPGRQSVPVTAPAERPVAVEV